MSMIGNFLLVSDVELARVFAKPELVLELVDSAYQEREADFADVDKAWHCLHFLLTGSAWEGEPPLNFIATGGREVGDEDVGYGPARGFSSAEVRGIATALEAIDRKDLVGRFDARQMNELQVYPSGWQEVDPSSEESFGYFSGAFDRVRELVRRGSGEGRGLLVWLS
jgi:hypothetical protein